MINTYRPAFFIILAIGLVSSLYGETKLQPFDESDPFLKTYLPVFELFEKEPANEFSLTKKGEELRFKLHGTVPRAGAPASSWANWAYINYRLSMSHAIWPNIRVGGGIIEFHTYPDRPDVSPREKPETIKAMNKYFVLCAAKTFRSLMDDYEPDYKIKYPYYSLIKPGQQWPDAGESDIEFKKRVAKIKADFKSEEAKHTRMSLKHAWNYDMATQLERGKGHFFRVLKRFVPGDKAYIKEILISELNLKTPEARKQFWDQTKASAGASWESGDDITIRTD